MIIAVIDNVLAWRNSQVKVPSIGYGGGGGWLGSGKAPPTSPVVDWLFSIDYNWWVKFNQWEQRQVCYLFSMVSASMSLTARVW